MLLHELRHQLNQKRGRRKFPLYNTRGTEDCNKVSIHKGKTMEKRLHKLIPKRRKVYCLLIDMVNSTRQLSSLPEDERCRFYHVFGQQLGPHLERLQLRYTQVSFEGDGWLLMTADLEEARKLGGLALILRETFKKEMRQRLESDANVPDIRIVICGGFDTPVLLGNGAGGFAANSGRKAARVPKHLADNQIVIDHDTQELLGTDFQTETIPVASFSDSDRPEQIPKPLYFLTKLRNEGDGERWRYVKDCLANEPETPAFINLKPALRNHDWNNHLQNLDFKFAWGGMTTKDEFCAESVTLEWLPEAWVPPRIMSDVTWAAAYQMAREACQAKRDFRFRPLGRVKDVIVGNDQQHLRLAMQRTMYAMFAATNLNLQKYPEGDFAKAVAFWAADNSEESRQPFLASALNVIGCVVSEDLCLILPRRSEVAFERPSSFQASTGGFVEEGEIGNANQQAANAFCREIREELGLTEETLRITFLGFGFNGPTGEPDLIALARTTLSGKEMRDHYRMTRREKIKQGRKDDELMDLAEDRTRGRQGAESERSFWVLGDSSSPKLLPDLLSQVNRSDSWSQPADRVAVIAALCRLFDEQQLRAALRSTKN